MREMGQQRLERFDSAESVSEASLAEAAAGLSGEAVAAVDGVVEALGIGSSPSELLVLRRRLLALAKSKAGPRAARLLPDELDRLRAANCLHSAARFIRKAAAALSNPGQAHFLRVQASVVLHEVVRLLRSPVPAPRESLSRVEASDCDPLADTKFAKEVKEPLATCRLKSAMEGLDDAGAFDNDDGPPWDLHLESKKKRKELNWIVSAVIRSTSNAKPASPSKPRLQPNAAAVSFKDPLPNSPTATYPGSPKAKLVN